MLNDPVNWIDPEGKSAFGVIVTVVGATGLGFGLNYIEQRYDNPIYQEQWREWLKDPKKFIDYIRQPKGPPNPNLPPLPPSDKFPRQETFPRC